MTFSSILIMKLGTLDTSKMLCNGYRSTTYMPKKTNALFTRPWLNTLGTYSCPKDSPWLKKRISASWIGQNLGKSKTSSLSLVLQIYTGVSLTTTLPALFPLPDLHRKDSLGTSPRTVENLSTSLNRHLHLHPS